MKRIIYENESGGVTILTPVISIEISLKDIPNECSYSIIDDEELPTDTFFRDAWIKNGNKVEVDLTKAKEIAHQMRREKRTKEFEPCDSIISKQIPGEDFSIIEEIRQNIRKSYHILQEKIDNASTPEQIKELMKEFL